MKEEISKWYVLLVQIGREAEIKDKIIKKLKEKVLEVVIPQAIDEETLDENFYYSPEDTKNYRFLSGYVFFKVNNLSSGMYNDVLRLVDVYKFLGAFMYEKKSRKYRPTIVPEEQMKIVKQILLMEPLTKKEAKTDYKVDELVRIKEGDFSSVIGRIVELTNSHAKILPQSIFKNIIRVALDNIVHAE